MSSIVSSITGGITGNKGGAGLNYDAASANILNPATTDQANQLYGQAQQGLTNQAGFLQAVQAQNGLGNQSSVFNQLQGVANGTGPNPAEAQLAQSTGQNVANQSALMAGQRGSSQNVGLIARQAAQQGANIQQQAAGQAATMQANQSLNALNSQGALATSQANQQANATNAYSQAAQSEQANTLGAIAAQNNANVGMTSNQNSANAGISGIAAKQQGDLVGNLTGGLGSALGLAEGGVIPKMADGGIIDTISKLAPLAMMANGGAPGTQLNTVSSGPKSNIGKMFSQNENLLGSNSTSPNAPPPSPLSTAGQTLGKGIGSGISNGISGIGDALGVTDYGKALNEGLDEMDHEQSTQNAINSGNNPLGGSAGASMPFAKGGRVPALVSPGEQYLKPKDVKKVLKGEESPLKAGERIPGKPKYPGNDYRNDTVPKTLEAGGLVIPNAVMQSKHPHWAAHKFVMAHMKEQALKKK